MNNPVPAPPKSTPTSKKSAVSKKREQRNNLIKPLRKKADRSKKLITYICTIPKRGKLVQVEVRATELLDVGKICYEKHGEYPINVEKKPFEMPEHLTQKLNDHEGLRSLVKTLNKEAGRK